MKTIYAYPGSFCPPTFGHLSIVKRAAEFLPEVIVVCSENSNKSGQWFSPQKCKELWKTYELPRNVKISTLGEFLSYSDPKNTNIVLIRGIRDESDMEQERQVMALNKNKFGIDKYLYILSDDEHKKISSTKARMAAQNLRLEELSAYVSPLVISALLEKTLDMKNIFMVVGRPGSGKSTFLRMLAEENAANVHIDTDEFNHELRPLLAKSFPGEDIYSVVRERESEVLKVITSPWLVLLGRALGQIPKRSNVFVEIPYGLEENKSIFRFIGGKILHIGCDDSEMNLQRNENRGTPNIAGFINKIPDREGAEKIAKAHGLQMMHIDTGCSLDELGEKAIIFSSQL